MLIAMPAGSLGSSNMKVLPKLNRDSVDTLLHNLENMHREQRQLFQQLRQSMLLEHLCPGIFKYGRVSIHWFSSQPKRNVTKWRGLAVMGNGEEVELPDGTYERLQECMKTTTT